MARKCGGTQAIRDLEPAVARPQSGYQLMFAEEATAWSGGLGEPSVRGWEREGGHRTLAPRARPGALTREPEATRLYFMVSLVGPKQTARSEEHTSELQSRFDLVCPLRLGTRDWDWTT